MIRDDSEYQDALRRIDELFNVTSRESRKGRELEELLKAVDEYEERLFPKEVRSE